MNKKSPKRVTSPNAKKKHGGGGKRGGWNGPSRRKTGKIGSGAWGDIAGRERGQQGYSKLFPNTPLGRKKGEREKQKVKREKSLSGHNKKKRVLKDR